MKFLRGRVGIAWKFCEDVWGSNPTWPTAGQSAKGHSVLDSTRVIAALVSTMSEIT